MSFVPGIVAEGGTGGTPTPTPTGHRYWRLRSTLNNGDSNFVVAVGVQFRDGAGVNQIGSGTAYASTGGGAGAALGFTAWTSSSSGYWSNTAGAPNSQWLGYDFGAGNDKAIESFTLTGVRAANRMPKDMQLQWSDDNVTWTTHGAPITGQTGWAINGTDTRTFTP